MSRTEDRLAYGPEVTVPSTSDVEEVVVDSGMGETVKDSVITTTEPVSWEEVVLVSSDGAVTEV